jgi:hypothetical protein
VTERLALGRPCAAVGTRCSPAAARVDLVAASAAHTSVFGPSPTAVPRRRATDCDAPAVATFRMSTVGRSQGSTMATRARAPDVGPERGERDSEQYAHEVRAFLAWSSMTSVTRHEGHARMTRMTRMTCTMRMNANAGE